MYIYTYKSWSQNYICNKINYFFPAMHVIEHVMFYKTVKVQIAITSLFIFLFQLFSRFAAFLKKTYIAQPQFSFSLIRRLVISDHRRGSRTIVTSWICRSLPWYTPESEGTEITRAARTGPRAKSNIFGPVLMASREPFFYRFRTREGVNWTAASKNLTSFRRIVKKKRHLHAGPCRW